MVLFIRNCCFTYFLYSNSFYEHTFSFCYAVYCIVVLTVRLNNKTESQYIVGCTTTYAQESGINTYMSRLFCRYFFFFRCLLLLFILICCLCVASEWAVHFLACICSQCCLYTMEYMWQPHVLFTQYTTAACKLLINPTFASMYLCSMLVLLYLALYKRIEAKKILISHLTQIIEYYVLTVHCSRFVLQCFDSNGSYLNYRLKNSNQVLWMVLWITLFMALLRFYWMSLKTLCWV